MSFPKLWLGAHASPLTHTPTAEKSGHLRGSASPAIDFRPKVKYKVFNPPPPNLSLGCIPTERHPWYLL